MLDELKKLLFDKRIADGLAKAFVYYSVQGKGKEAEKYKELLIEINELKIRMRE